MNKYQYWGGVQSLISTPFNLQLFANKFISLNRMKDFLGGCKNIFFMQTDHLSNNEITTLVDGIMNPQPVDLSNYAIDNIPNYENITEIPQENLNYLNSGLVASSMASMFVSCNNLQSIPKLNIDTSQCTSMNSMFYLCQALISLNLSNFNTSKVTDMSNMFNGCSSLTTLDLSSFDTSNVIDMYGMFGNCYSLEHIEGVIDMKSCTNYYDMFYNCTKLSGLKIKNPPQAYYDNKTQFESDIGLTSDQYEIVS